MWWNVKHSGFPIVLLLVIVLNLKRYKGVYSTTSTQPQCYGKLQVAKLKQFIIPLGVWFGFYTEFNFSD